MKMVMAIVKPFKLDDIREALYELDIQGMTVSDVMGCGRQQGAVRGRCCYSGQYQLFAEDKARGCRDRR